MIILAPYLVIDYILIVISLPFVYRKIKLLKQVIPKLTAADTLHWQSYKRKVRIVLLWMLLPFLILIGLLIAGEWISNFYKIIAKLSIVISFVCYFSLILHYKPRIFHAYLSNNQKQQWQNASRVARFITIILSIIFLIILLIL